MVGWRHTKPGKPIVTRDTDNMESYPRYSGLSNRSLGACARWYSFCDIRINAVVDHIRGGRGVI